MEKKHLWLLIAFLVLLNVFSICQNKYKRTPDKENVVPNHFEFFLSEILKARILSDGRNVDPNFLLIDERGDSIFLKKLVSQKTMLVVWISELSCQACVDSVMNRVLNYVKDNSLHDQTLIFADYGNQHYLSAYKRLNQVTLPFYRPIDKNILPGLDLAPPFLFVIDSSMRFSNLFFHGGQFLNNELDFYLQTFNDRFSN
jgi:hypothetical protein